MPLSVIIVGGGLAGLSAAIALRHADHEVLVLERRLHNREVGQNVSILSNATRVLRSFGMDFNKTRMTPFAGMEIFKANVTPMQRTLEMDDTQAEKKWGTPSFSAHRQDLHEGLRDIAVGEGKGVPVQIREGVTVESYDINAGLVVLVGGEALHADLIVAADGVKSKAHKWVLGEERPARLTGWSNVRFVVPTETLKQNPGLAYVLDRGGYRTAVYENGNGQIGIFRASIRAGTLQNFGIYAKHDTRPGEGDLANQWITKTNKELSHERIKGFSSDMQSIVEYANEDEMYLWNVADRDPLPTFHRGRLVLVGDACHPMLPFLGQGACMAIEDAGVLGILMTGVENVNEVSKRLKVWEDLRKNRVSFTQLCARSESCGKWYLSEENIKKLKPFVQDGKVPTTRPEVHDIMQSFDCLAEARQAVEERLGMHVNGVA